MTQYSDDYVRAFRDAGWRITPQRRLIFAILAEDVDHPTAEEVYQRAVLEMPDVSRSTVYNTLNALVELDELATVEDISDAGTRYDTETENHHHLYCLRCGKLLDLHREFEGLALPQEETQGYQIVGHQVTFRGYCPECSRRTPRRASGHERG